MPSSHNIAALVVDDVFDNRQILNRILCKAGIDVEEACNGQEALDKIALRTPKLVFMDIRMPVMGGLEAFQEIRKRWPEAPIKCIAITASSLMHEKKAYLDAGFDDYIAKPFRFKQIFASIESMLGITLKRRPVLAKPAAPEILHYDRMTIPEPLYQELYAATEINAFSQLESLIAQMRLRQDADLPKLANRFEELLDQYNTNGIADILNEVAHQ